MTIKTFKKTLNTLAEKESRHTALVTLYCPSNKQPHDVISALDNEIAQSKNIKQRVNRTNVIKSIKHIKSQIKKLTDFGPNGYVFFAGPTKKNGRNINHEITTIKMPIALSESRYVCGPKYVIQPLLSLIDDENIYGVIQFSNKYAMIASLQGVNIQYYKKYTSGIHSKHKAGGQSARRFQRIIEQGHHAFAKKIAEDASTYFMSLENFTGIIIGGTGNAKLLIQEKKLLDYRLQNKIVGVVDICYHHEAGIREILNLAAPILKKTQYIREQKAWDDFLYWLGENDSERTEFGMKQVIAAMLNNRVEKILVLEQMPWEYETYTCEECKLSANGHFISNMDRTCPICNTHVVTTPISHSIAEIEGLAHKKNVQIDFISLTSNVGVALASFGGIVAILRY